MQLQSVYKIFQKKSVRNLFWLSFDKVFKILISIIIGAWAARFYGPSDLGRLNYVTAYITIFSTISTLGMDAFLVKEILSKNNNKYIVLGSAFLLRICSSVLIFFIGYLFFCNNDVYIGLYLFLSLTLLFSPFDLIDVEFQSTLNSKKTVISKNIAYFIGAIVKMYFLYTEKPIIWFAATIGIETILAYSFLILQYQFQNKSGILNWKITKAKTKEILEKAWPFTISGLAVILYMRVDQIMIGKLLTINSVGIFSAAVRISELFTFIPMAISSSYFSTLMTSVNSEDKQEFIKKNKLLFNWMLLFAIIIAIFFTIFANEIIHILFGNSFRESIFVLQVQIWTLIPIFLGVASFPYFAIENLQKISLYKTICGLILNIILNFFFIPYYGVVGAAFATLISQFFTSIISNALFSRTKIVFTYQISSFKSIILLKFNDFKI